MPAAPAASDPVLGDTAPNPFKGPLEPASAAERDGELGVRKYDFAAFWHRLKNNFRGPPTSNPKLVNYLAAEASGSPSLRYEKRVARNRFILFVAILVLACGVSSPCFFGIAEHLIRPMVSIVLLGAVIVVLGLAAVFFFWRGE